MIKENYLKSDRANKYFQLDGIQLVVIVGNKISSDQRSLILQGERPRIDVLEMESLFGARLVDFSWLEQRAKETPLIQWMFRAAKRTGDWSSWLAWALFFSRIEEDVVYATGEDVGLPLAAILRLTGRKRPYIVLRLEQPTYGRTSLRRFIYSILFRFAVKRVNRIICRTQAHVSYIIQNLGVSPGATTFFPETTDTHFFNPSAPSRLSSIQMLIPAKPYIVSAGLEMRDYDTLIAAVRDLDVRVVIGAGSPWSKFRFKLVNGSTLPENTQVSTFNPVQMRELYRSASLVVVPVKPTMRACGMNVVLEAWAMGRPIIASRTEGLVDYIQDGETGLFVEPGNVEDLRSKILQLLTNPLEATRLGKNGYRWVRTELCLERYLQAVRSRIISTEPISGTRHS